MNRIALGLAGLLFLAPFISHAVGDDVKRRSVGQAFQPDGPTSCTVRLESLTYDSAAVLANAVHEGKVVSLDNADRKIVVLIKGSDEREFKIDEKCEVTLDGKKADLDKVEEGASVKLMTKKVKGQELVVKIDAKSAE